MTAPAGIDLAAVAADDVLLDRLGGKTLPGTTFDGDLDGLLFAWRRAIDSVAYSDVVQSESRSRISRHTTRNAGAPMKLLKAVPFLWLPVVAVVLGVWLDWGSVLTAVAALCSVPVSGLVTVLGSPTAVRKTLDGARQDTEPNPFDDLPEKDDDQ